MTTENDKANAKILLSADEAVAKKILDVLAKNPDVLRKAVQDMHMEDERRRYEMQMHAMQNQMAAQQSRLAYPKGGITQVNQDELQRGWWSGVFGGNK